MSSDDLASTLFGATRRRVLGWLLLHPDEDFYLREIVRLTGAAHGAVQRELGTLTRVGLLTRTARGRQVYFGANRSANVFPELSALLVKTTGISDILRSALLPLEASITSAFVFGSAARGELRSESDIDVLVVGDVPFADLVEALAEAQVLLGREVNPTVYPSAEFAERLRKGHHFLSALRVAPKVYLLGGDHELGRLAPEWLGGTAPDKPRRNRRAT